MDQNLHFICKLRKQKESLSLPNLQIFPTISSHSHDTISKILIINPEVVQGNCVFFHVWRNADAHRSGLRPISALQNILGVFWRFLETSHVFMFICIFHLVASSLLPGDGVVKIVPAPVPIFQSETRWACFRKSRGDGALLMRMACPLQPPQAWSWAVSWEHQLLRAVCFNPLKDLSAKSSMAWCSVVFKEFPRGLELDRPRTNLFTCDGNNQTPVSGWGKWDRI